MIEKTTIESKVTLRINEKLSIKKVIGNNENELRKIHLKMQQKEIQGHWRNFKNTLFEERKAIKFLKKVVEIFQKIVVKITYLNS